jgi:hypothetical protein
MEFLSSLTPLLKPVFIGAIATYVFGWLWYGIVFQKTWMMLKGIPLDFKPDPKEAIKPMVIKFVLDVLTATAFCFVAFIPNSLQYTYIVSGIVWFGFILPGFMGPYLWDKKSFKLVCFDGLFSLLSFALLAAVVYYVR